MQTPAPATPQAPAPTAPVLAGDADLGTLQGQAADLQAQLAGLRAQWNGLKTQLDNMLRNNPARPGVQQQWANVGIELANTEGKLASIQARIAQKQGRPVGAPNAPVTPRFAPNVAFPAVSVVALVLLFPISVAWAKRMGRRIDRPAAGPSDLATRLGRMEHAIDTIAIEVERISEGQRFVTKLMADRAGNAAAERASADSSSQAKPPLALGAGPIEPIALGQRDQVRERVVTPH